MKLASFRGRHLSKNIIFDASHESNRDNCFDPYVQLQAEFRKYGVSLNTSDLNVDENIFFELHHDVQAHFHSGRSYLLLLETEYAYLANANLKKLAHYRKVFTWREDFLGDPKFIKLYLPNPILIPKINGWTNRDLFCSLIAGNKALAKSDEKDLYVERVKTIRWFEKNAPEDFKLYGLDWNLPAIGRGVVGKVARKVLKKLSLLIKFKSFPSYIGPVLQKSEIYSKSRYSICYENVRDIPGYVTEKIFDCFFSGCVPVYWGASNIKELIPQECFIDRRDFKDTASLYLYLKGITEARYIEYQKNIVNFLNSDAAYRFSSDHFAKTIVEAIAIDLDLKATSLD